MFSLQNLRRMVTVCLVSVTFFIGIGLNPGNTTAIADSITRDSVDFSSDTPVSDAQYEADKVSRQQRQAMRSELADQDNENKSISDKLNLDEALPRSTKKFGEQITGDEPINNETRPK